MLNNSNLKAFISDLHGELDVFQYLNDRQFGLIALALDHHLKQELSAEQKEAFIGAVTAMAAGLEESELGSLFTAGFDKELFFTVLLAMLVHFPPQDQSLCLALNKYGWLLTLYRALISEQLSASASEGATAELEVSTNKPLEISVLRDILYQNIRSLQASEFFAVSKLMAQALVAQLTPELNVVGDVYDRGQDAFTIMELLCQRNNVAVQWGNHDVVWMGAASGNLACIAVAIRICLRYGTMNMLTRDYTIDLSTLSAFSEKTYADDPCDMFLPKNFTTQEQKMALARMHKAISMIQFKLEGQLVQRRPEYGMQDRLLFEGIDEQFETITLAGEAHPLLDRSFPTLDLADPYQLSPEEKKVIMDLRTQFLDSPGLSKHMAFLYENGSMAKTTDSWLLLHACVPVEQDGSLKEFRLSADGDQPLAGAELFDFCERELRRAYLNRYVFNTRNDADIAWYLWCGPHSPLFGKERMTTFERYFVEDKNTHKEGKNDYYVLRDQPEFIKSIAQEFQPENTGTTKVARLVNGHVPVKYARGEKPVMAEGKLFSIDGGFSRPYRSSTGIAGFVLLEFMGFSYLYRVESHQCESGMSYALELEHQTSVAPH